MILISERNEIMIIWQNQRSSSHEYVIIPFSFWLNVVKPMTQTSTVSTFALFFVPFIEFPNRKPLAFVSGVKEKQMTVDMTISTDKHTFFLQCNNQENMAVLNDGATKYIDTSQHILNFWGYSYGHLKRATCCEMGSSLAKHVALPTCFFWYISNWLVRLHCRFSIPTWMVSRLMVDLATSGQQEVRSGKSAMQGLTSTTRYMLILVFR